MDTLEKAHERVQAICEKIRNETLQPARDEAQDIIARAKKDAEKIIDQAKHEAEKVMREGKRKLEEEKQIFKSSLEQAAKQSIETIKQKIEKTLLNPALDTWIEAQTATAEMNAKLVDAIVHALEKEGMKANLQVEIPKSISPDVLVSLLATDVKDRLKSGAIEVSGIQGGVQVRLEGKHVMIDLSDTMLKELVTSFVRKDFRKYFFTNA